MIYQILIQLTLVRFHRPVINSSENTVIWGTIDYFPIIKGIKTQLYKDSWGKIHKNKQTNKKPLKTPQKLKESCSREFIRRKQKLNPSPVCEQNLSAKQCAARAGQPTGSVGHKTVSTDDARLSRTGKKHGTTQQLQSTV